MIWLQADDGFDQWDTYALVGQVRESSIGNVVDPLDTVVAKFPRRYLPR